MTTSNFSEIARYVLLSEASYAEFIDLISPFTASLGSHAERSGVTCQCVSTVKVHLLRLSGILSASRYTSGDSSALRASE